jgi:hypothetical protein
MEFRKGIREIEIEGEKLSLVKKSSNWKIVHPIKDLNGKIIWKNLIAGGDWWKILTTLGLVLVILLCLYDWANAINIANNCLNELNSRIIIP